LRKDLALILDRLNYFFQKQFYLNPKKQFSNKLIELFPWNEYQSYSFDRDGKTK